MRRLGSLFLGLLIVTASCAALLQGPAKAQQSLQVDKILVVKSKRVLTLFNDGRPVKSYRISLGRQPIGAKTRRGDGKTPEGKYTIDRHNPYSRFHLALHVSYPDVDDIASARRLGVSPGGDIMIHGLPNGHGPRWQWKQFTDWTAGCIAVSDRDIEEIYRSVRAGTQIEIRP